MFLGEAKEMLGSKGMITTSHSVWMTTNSWMCIAGTPHRNGQGEIRDGVESAAAKHKLGQGHRSDTDLQQRIKSCSLGVDGRTARKSSSETRSDPTNEMVTTPRMHPTRMVSNRPKVGGACLGRTFLIAIYSHPHPRWSQQLQGGKEVAARMVPSFERNGSD
jgi:hypothetical protein